MESPLWRLDGRYGATVCACFGALYCARPGPALCSYRWLFPRRDRRVIGSLLKCPLRAYEQAYGVVARNTNRLTAAQSAIVISGVIVTLGIGKRFCAPCEQPEPLADRLNQHCGLLESRQVEVA